MVFAAFRKRRFWVLKGHFSDLGSAPQGNFRFQEGGSFLAKARLIEFQRGIYRFQKPNFTVFQKGSFRFQKGAVHTKTAFVEIQKGDLRFQKGHSLYKDGLCRDSKGQLFSFEKRTEWRFSVSKRIQC
jgi:hypothetical protein